jgi:hypothetical protein
LKSAELEARFKALETRMQATEDIEAIKKLQRAYGYYLEHWETDQLTSLFSHSPEVSFEVNDTGEFKGWEAVQKCFDFSIHFSAYGGVKKAPGEFLHVLPALSGIVTLGADGKTAKGRWYGYFYGSQRREGKNRALVGCGIWENDYIKEKGIWKILKIYFNEIFCSPWEEGWVKYPSIPNYPLKVKPPPARNVKFLVYPSGYIFPYHYKNPVTGK